MKENSPIHIDIGGGPDISEEQIPELQIRSIQTLRSVQLAQTNPEGTYIVVDPELPNAAIGQSDNLPPNLHFVEGEGGKLPLRTELADAVEMNHLFFPIAIADATRLENAIKGKVSKFEDDLVSSANGMVSRQEVESKSRAYEQELLEEAAMVFKDREEKIDLHALLEDFDDYFSLVAEAARVLKSGGRLRLGEKREVVEIISELLHTSQGQILLEQAGLQIGSIELNTDEYKSAYAKLAQGTQERHGAQGRPERALAVEPTTLTLVKK